MSADMNFKKRLQSTSFNVWKKNQIVAIDYPRIPDADNDDGGGDK